MMDYTKIDPYALELDRICEEKIWKDITIKNTLGVWLLSIEHFYNSNANLLESLSLEEYIECNFEKLKQTKDMKVLKLEEIIKNPDCLLYQTIKQLPFNSVYLEEKLSKCEEGFQLDEKGEYYLSASGICRGGKTIELVNKREKESTFHHELQHINQNYIYPSELPFAKDILEMLHEGEAEYHAHLLDMILRFLPIEKENQYYIYYLVYTLLMFTIPKEIRKSWNKKENITQNPYMFADLFKNVFASEEKRKNYSQIFALATTIVASCNSKNTKEIFNASIETSRNRCFKKREGYNQMISFVLEQDRKKNLEGLQFHIKEVSERIKILENPSLLEEKYIEIITEEKEFIESEPKEKQEELLQELQLFTLEKYKSIVKEEIKEGEESIRKYQNKKEQSPQEILGNEDDIRYHYYEFGMELGEEMQILLSQELTFTELFQKFLEKIESGLMERKEPNLEAKLSFMNEIRKNCLQNSKKI